MSTDSNSVFPMTGIHYAEGNKTTLSIARVGRPQSDESRRKISEATKGEKIISSDTTILKRLRKRYLRKIAIGPLGIRVFPGQKKVEEKCQ
jgi:hypothetical protein